MVGNGPSRVPACLRVVLAHRAHGKGSSDKWWTRRALRTGSAEAPGHGCSSSHPGPCAETPRRLVGKSAIGTLCRVLLLVLSVCISLSGKTALREGR